MKDGFIKIAAVSPEMRVADCVYNAEKITEAMSHAAKDGVHLLVLPAHVLVPLEQRFAQSGSQH